MNTELEAIIDAELASRISELKEITYSDLKRLDGNPMRGNREIQSKVYEFSSWAEQAIGETDGVLAVLTDTWKNNIIGSSRYMKGFLRSPNGIVRELNESELWEYD